MTKTLRILVEVTVDELADPTNIADAIFDGLYTAAAAVEDAFPDSLLSIDYTEVLR